jgi:hypothetical protein
MNVGILRYAILSASIIFMPSLFSGSTANAQRDPVTADRKVDEHQVDRTAASAGRFMIIRNQDDLILVDGQTGCTWSRSKNNRDPYNNSLWKFEFPAGALAACYKELDALRARPH